MRKFLAIAATAAVATVAFGASPAQAQCPDKDGTVPGTGPSTLAVGPFYIDDRDFADANQNEDTGGIWIYHESGKLGGLQRGGDQMVMKLVPMPYQAPVPTPLPHPTKPGQPFVLFPEGVGGGNLSQTAGNTDDCVRPGYTAAQRDNVVF